MCMRHNMCAHHEREGQGHEYNNLTGVAWSILVMGLSLAAVVILWVWFGYIGPTFSEDVLSNQQRTLRENFGLPVQETSDDPEVLQTPPSLRNTSQDQEANMSNNSATTTVTTANTKLMILLRKVQSCKAKLLKGEQQLLFYQELRYKEIPIMNQMKPKYH